MGGNSFGRSFVITTYGESHGRSVGVIIDGCPAGVPLSEADIQPELDRRRPGQSALTTPRSEADTIEIHSGVYQGHTTGTPIMLMVHNADHRSQDYASLSALYRPSHADFTYQKKYGLRDPRGGGRSSARETLARVAAGAVAKKVLSEQGISVVAYVDQVYTVKASIVDPLAVTRDHVDATPVRCPDAASAEAMSSLILKAKEEGDSLGGIVRCITQGLPVGLGEPVFDKLPAELGKAMLSINAVKGFEFGSGFSCVEYKGSEHNDEMQPAADGKVGFATNRAGGSLGGISNGAPLDFRVAFKPTATILRQQNTVDTAGNAAEFTAQGRHDPCVLPRAVPIVEAMTWLVLVDLFQRN
jgi:chorismate synthase